MTMLKFKLSKGDFKDWKEGNGFLNIIGGCYEGTNGEIEREYDIKNYDLKDDSYAIYLHKELLSLEMLYNMLEETHEINDYDYCIEEIGENEVLLVVAINWRDEC